MEGMAKGGALVVQRWNSLDALKGAACLAVCLIHYPFPGTMGVCVKAACRFAVPVFLMISGFFLADADGCVDDARVARKMRHIACLTVTAVLFYAAFTVLFDSIGRSGWDACAFATERLTADRWVKCFLTNDPFLYAHLWFLLALMECYLFVLFAFPGGRRMRAIAVLAPVLLVGYSLLQEFKGALPFPSSVQLPGMTSRVYLFNLFLFRALPFFLFGVLLRRNQERVARWRIATPVLALAALGGCVLAAIERLLVAEAQFFIGSYVTVAALFVWALKHPQGGNRALCRVGRELSTAVYVLHIAVGQTMDAAARSLGVSGRGWYAWTRGLLVMAITLLIAQAVNWARKGWLFALTSRRDRGML